MIYGIYSMYDKVAEFHTSFNLDHNDNSAMRNFRQALSSPDFKIRGEDFDLYKHGTFDNETGELVSIKPEIIMKGVSFDE